MSTRVRKSQRKNGERPKAHGPADRGAGRPAQKEEKEGSEIMQHHQRNVPRKEERAKRHNSIFESVFNESYVPFEELFEETYLGQDSSATSSEHTSKAQRDEDK